MQDAIANAGAWVTEATAALSQVLWGPAMLLLMTGTGIFLTWRTGFVQLRKAKDITKTTVDALFVKSSRGSRKNISPLQAVATALSGTIGVGNVVGVATAIAAGGPGAIFWMWVSAFFGMATKYSEVVLAVHFREKDAHGLYIGGPMYYIEKGLGKRWLGVAFAALCVLASFGIGNMAQANTIAISLQDTFSLPAWVSGVGVAVLVGIVMVGGIRRIADVTGALVPFMAIFYIVGSCIVIFTHIEAVPDAFGAIVRGAFAWESAAGGVAGYTIAQAMRFGVARGVFSNEAGLGSAPIAHAAADTDHPVKQGFFGVFEVFVDTIVISTMTALVLLTSGVPITESNAGLMTANAFSSSFGGVGGAFVNIAVFFFAIASIIGWSLYGERSLRYICRGGRAAAYVYRVVFIAVIVVGSVAHIALAWQFSDIFNALMAVPNLIALLALSGVVGALTRSWRKRK